MSKHPYPEHVVEIVTDKYIDLEYEHIAYEGKTKTYRDTVNMILQALWDSSRVDDLHGLPDRAIYVDEHGGVGIVGRARQTGHCDMNQPATILYWGDANE